MDWYWSTARFWECGSGSFGLEEFIERGRVLLRIINALGSRSFLVWLALFAMPGQAIAQGEDVDLSCLDEIPQLLEKADLKVYGLFFCEDFAEGVQISLRDLFLIGNRRGSYQGGGPVLLNFRHKNFVARQKNRLETILVPRTKELWDVHWRDPLKPDLIFETSGNSKFIVWGTNTRAEGLGALPLPLDDNSMRVFACNASLDKACLTHYNVSMCDGYMYPKVRARNFSAKLLVAKPTIRVVGRGAKEIQNMLENYGRINLLVRHAIKDLMEISCK